MHLSDGILPPSVWAGGYAIALGATGFALRRFDERRIPQVAVLASLFFVASGVAIPLPGGASGHLLLNGLVGVVLGWDAFPAILLSLFLQWLLLGNGGIASLGVNTVTMAGGALAGCSAFQVCRILPRRAGADFISGLLAGAAGIAASAALFFAALSISDPRYRTLAALDIGAHLPLLLIEPPVTAFAIVFLAKVKPDLLGRKESAT